MKQLYINDKQVKGYLLEIFRQMSLDNFKPDVVVGLVRGGSVPANYVSQYFDIPCLMLNKDFDSISLEGYKKVLVIDDINDSGTALTEVNDYFYSLGINDVKYATLLSNEGSAFTVDYQGTSINKIEDPCWVVFPWENWWLSL